MPLSSPSPNSTIVVTGASSGIGEQIARSLATRKYNLTLVARRLELLEALRDELEAHHGISVAVMSSDLLDDRARSQLCDDLLAADKEVVGLVNNAGFGSIGLFSELPLERNVQQVRLNNEALVELSHRLIGPMLERREGAILNIASTAGFQPLPVMAVYSATKVFVITYSDALSVELAGTGVSVTSLCPGSTTGTEFGKVAGATPAKKRRSPIQLKLNAHQVAEAGVEGMIRGTRTVVPGILNKATAIGGRYVPRRLLLAAMERMRHERIAAAMRIE